MRGRNDTYGPPLFSIALWNHHDAAVEGIARSTNIVEGWHHSLQALYQCHHPTMWTFLDGIKQDMQKQKVLLLQGVAGGTHTTSRKYRDLNERVQRAVQSFGKTDVLTYLRALAHLSHA